MTELLTDIDRPVEAAPKRTTPTVCTCWKAPACARR